MAGEDDNKEDVKNEINHNKKAEDDFDLNEFPTDEGRPLHQESIFLYTKNLFLRLFI